jgi:hypothetical protein
MFNIFFIFHREIKDVQQDEICVLVNVNKCNEFEDRFHLSSGFDMFHIEHVFQPLRRCVFNSAQALLRY